MSKSSLRVLLEQGGPVTVRGLPKALDGKLASAIFQPLPGGKGSAVWGAIGKKLEQTTLELLDVDLMEVLAAAWGKYQVLAEYADDRPDTPPATHEVSLADHTMSVTFHPTIDVTVEGLGRGSLTFDLKVTATVKGIQLTVRRGRITRVSTGSCRGSVTLELDRVPLVDQDFPEVDLPGVVDLGEGIAIPRVGQESGAGPDHKPALASERA